MPDERLTSLTVVLPCFDEEENVAGRGPRGARRPRAARAERRDRRRRRRQHATRTRAIAAACAARRPARARRRARATTAATARPLRTGIAAARCDWVLLTDGDLQFDLAELARFVAPAADHDLVAGYRIARMDPLHAPG